VLIANSGIAGPTLLAMPPNPSLSQYREYLWNTSITEFTKTMEVNTSAVYLCIIAFLELLAEGNKRKNVEQLSQVIAISSIGAYNRVPLGGFAYSASKAGTTHMMKQLATAFVPFNIRSNVIAPGSTSPTPLPPSPRAVISGR
jgi:NAD(P)-dependent dehydrogenase (short-subunit alcohol dehydrogenase family)